MPPTQGPEIQNTRSVYPPVEPRGSSFLASRSFCVLAKIKNHSGSAVGGFLVAAATESLLTPGDG